MGLFNIESSKYGRLKKTSVVEGGKYVKLPKAFVVEGGKYVKLWSAISNKFISLVYWAKSGSGGKSSLYTSDDCATWTLSVDDVGTFRDAKTIHGNGVCIYYQYGNAYVTSDYKVFTKVTLPTGVYSNTITFEDGVFYLVGGSYTSGTYEGMVCPTYAVYTSQDGVNWTSLYSGMYAPIYYQNSSAAWNVDYSACDPSWSEHYLIKGKLYGVEGMHIITHYIKNTVASGSYNLYWITSEDGGKTWYAPSNNYASTMIAPSKDKDGGIYIITNASTKNVSYKSPDGKTVTMRDTTSGSSYGLQNVTLLHEQGVLMGTRTINGSLEVYSAELKSGAQAEPLFTLIASGLPSGAACSNFVNYALRLNEDYICLWSKAASNTYQGIYSKDGVTWTVFDHVLEDGRLAQTAYLFSVIPSE